MKRILKWIWKRFVQWNGVILSMAVILVLIERLDAYVANHLGGKRQFNIWEDLTGNIFMGFFIIFMFVIIPMVVLIVNYGVERRCPDCKKWYCLKMDGEKLIKCEDIQILAEVKIKDKWGHVIGTQEQYVPGTRKTYHKNYTCRKCGAVSFRTYLKDEKNT